MNTLICRIPSQSTSGYKKLINKTISILDRYYDLILIPFGNSYFNCNDYKYGKLNKDNFRSPELIISPLILDRYFSFSNVLPDKDNILMLSMWESSFVPKFPVEELNLSIKKTLVPSEWNLEVFRNSGVERVDYLPLFVDDSIFKYKPKLNLDKFTFFAGACSSASTGNDKRKNFNIILKCFKKAFKGVKDVELKFKLSACEKVNHGFYLDERIIFNYNNLNDVQFADFMAESDIFISASKAEGWGFFQIESLALGRPVITCNYGSIKDFCNKDNSFFVDYTEELASNCWGKNGGCWAEIKEESLIEQMRFCYENKDVIRNNWQTYSNSIIPKFSLEVYEKNLINKLNEI